MATPPSRSSPSRCRAPRPTVDTGAMTQMEDNLTATAEPGGEELWKNGSPNLRLLQEIDVRLSVEVGSAQLRIRDLLNLNEGSVVELDRQAGAPLDVFANGPLIRSEEQTSELQSLIRP